MITSTVTHCVATLRVMLRRRGSWLYALVSVQCSTIGVHFFAFNFFSNQQATRANKNDGTRPISRTKWRDLTGETLARQWQRHLINLNNLPVSRPAQAALPARVALDGIASTDLVECCLCGIHNSDEPRSRTWRQLTGVRHCLLHGLLRRSQRCLLAAPPLCLALCRSSGGPLHRRRPRLHSRNAALPPFAAAAAALL